MGYNFLTWISGTFSLTECTWWVFLAFVGNSVGRKVIPSLSDGDLPAVLFSRAHEIVSTFSIQELNKGTLMELSSSLNAKYK